MSNANFPSVSPLDSFYTVSGLDPLKTENHAGHYFGCRITACVYVGN
ncbi:Uncharacterised protein [Haemophilus influenzae]|uniref:Uncharacterized protein n=1 Tax=Haemophilus influenzae TaxID=727 RepID=A0A2X1PVK0_HAEIF|nr:Uncharacterised protein [Haemophilus influenzae]